MNFDIELIRTQNYSELDFLSICDNTDREHCIERLLTFSDYNRFLKDFIEWLIEERRKLLATVRSKMSSD